MPISCFQICVFVKSSARKISMNPRDSEPPFRAKAPSLWVENGCLRSGSRRGQQESGHPNFDVGNRGQSGLIGLPPRTSVHSQTRTIEQSDPAMPTLSGLPTIALDCDRRVSRPAQRECARTKFSRLDRPNRARS